MKKNTLKRNVSLVLGAAMLLGTAPAYAADKVTVNLNGNTMNFDVDPIIENSRTLVPFRSIFEALDCAVSYSKADGVQTVTANKGDKCITLEIGKNEITVDGKTTQLDVAPKIVNGRTLVPLRAISESLDCKVDWFDDIKTVNIEKKYGQYDVTSAHISKNITDDNGNIIITVECEYPVIESKDNNDFIKSLNEQYKKDAETFVSDTEANFKGDAKEQEKYMADNFRTMVFTRSFDVTLNRNNMLSITQLDYSNTNGAHPNTVRSSKTFDMAENKELSLKDVLGMNETDTTSYVKDKFDEYVKKNAGENADYYKGVEGSMLKAVNFCLTDTSLVMYYNPYDILPYAAGVPKVEVPYTDKNGDVKVDLSGANLDELAFTLENTQKLNGYKWTLVDADSDRLDIQETVKDDGSADYVVKGMGEGNAIIYLQCVKADDISAPAKAEAEYDVYVGKDNKITVIDSFENDL
jgi:hypothetical protein